jgi:hypothetical protein
MKAILIGFLVLILAAINAPNFYRSPEYNQLSNAQIILRKIIEAEDEHFQKTGAYFTLDAAQDNLIVKRILRGFNVDCSGCEFAVAVSGLAFTAEAKASLPNNEIDYLGYVRTGPGKHIGIAGKMSACTPEGVFAGSRKLVNTIGPCCAHSWKTMGVISGSMKRLAIETLPSDADVFLDGSRIGKTTTFHGTISENYGYLFVEHPPKSPINVVVSKPGYETVRFALDWNDFTYQATIPLKANQ